MNVAAGEAIHLGCWKLSEESVRNYLNAVGDDQGLYLELGLAPPLALCAYALGAMLEKLSLPAGAIHSIQEMEAASAAAIGQDIHGEAVPERPRKRGGLQFMTVAYSLKDESGNLLQTGRTTVLTPAGDA